jgi:hypothetical protein
MKLINFLEWGDTSPLGRSANTWPIVPTRMVVDDECGTVSGTNIGYLN